MQAGQPSTACVDPSEHPPLMLEQVLELPKGADLDRGQERGPRWDSGGSREEHWVHWLFTDQSGSIAIFEQAALNISSGYGYFIIISTLQSRN